MSENNDGLKKSTEYPLYQQLRDKLKSKIDKGEDNYAPGQKIPSEQSLCEQNEVSRVTVRKAMEELVQEGLLIRRQGKGTFVAEKRIERYIREYPGGDSSEKKLSQFSPVTGFTEACKSVGFIPSTQLISLKSEKITSKEVQIFSASETDKMIEIIRLRKANDIPVVLEINRFHDNAQFNYLLEESKKLEGSLFDLLKKKNTEPKYCTHTITLGHATPFVAQQLQCSVGDALLLLDEVAYMEVKDENDEPLIDENQDPVTEPIYCGRQWIRADKFAFRV